MIDTHAYFRVFYKRAHTYISQIFLCICMGIYQLKYCPRLNRKNMIFEKKKPLIKLYKFSLFQKTNN